MPSLNPHALRRLDQVLQQQIDAGRLPGAVVAIASGAELAHLATLGRRDPARDQPMAADAIFRIYSMTKPIVSLAALMLAETGQLQLGDTVAQHLPVFADLRVGTPRGILEKLRRPPTLHDLLRHTAGFTYEFTGDEAVHQQYRAANLARRDRNTAQFCQALAELPLLAQPGSCWEYSHATDVLGAVLEAICGETLDLLLQRMILGPLGMRDTAFSVPEAQQARIAEPFAQCPESGRRVALLDPREVPAMASGGGGLMSTAADYLRFMQLLRQGGVFDGQRLVSRKTIEWMTADHLGAGLPRNDMLPAGHGFGLGVAVRTATGLGPQPGSKGMYFWSGIGGTFFFIDPAENIAALLLAQAPNQRIFLRNLFRHLVYAALD